MHQIDIYLTQVIQSFPSFLLPVSQFMDFIGSSNGYILLILIVLFYFDYKLAVNITLLISFSFVVNSILKIGIRIPRPFEVEDSVRNYLNVNRFIGYGMPSGHSQSAMVLWLFANKKILNNILKLLILIFLLIMGLSRIYLGVHWTSQVIVGFFIGYIYWLFSIKFQNTQFIKHFQKMNSQFKMVTITIFSLLITLGALSNMMIFNDFVSSNVFLLGKDVFTGSAFFAGSGCGAVKLLDNYSIRYNRYRFAGTIRFITGTSLMLILFIPSKIAINHFSKLDSSPFYSVSLLYALYFTIYIFSFFGFYLVQLFFNRLRLVFLEPKGEVLQ